MLSSGLRYQLLSGPYHPPRARRGGHLFCEMRGSVKVGGYSDGAIPWPVKWGTRSLVLCGDLIEAVKQESEVAVGYHWGVSIKVVQKWRRALEVEMYNTGTRMLQHRSGLENATPARMRRITALARKAGRRRKSKAWRRRTAESVRRRIAASGPINPRHRLWQPTEDRMLGTASDEELAVRLGRSPGALRSRRGALGIELEARRNPLWTRAKEKLLGTASDAEVARLLGRGERGVQIRRQALGIQKYRGIAKARPWEASEDAVLGTKPDREVARLLRRPLNSVQIRRHLKGIPNPAPLRKSWTAEEDQLLISLGNQGVMKRTGRSPQAIAYRRASLGIPNPQPKRWLWKPDQTALLGKFSDHEVARRLGCAVRTVKTKRAHLGIAAPEAYG